MVKIKIGFMINVNVDILTLDKDKKITRIIISQFPDYTENHQKSS